MTDPGLGSTSFCQKTFGSKTFGRQAETYLPNRQKEYKVATVSNEQMSVDLMSIG